MSKKYFNRLTNRRLRRALKNNPDYAPRVSGRVLNRARYGNSASSVIKAPAGANNSYED